MALPAIVYRHIEFHYSPGMSVQKIMLLLKPNVTSLPSWTFPLVSPSARREWLAPVWVYLSMLAIVICLCERHRQGCWQRIWGVKIVAPFCWIETLAVERKKGVSNPSDSSHGKYNVHSHSAHMLWRVEATKRWTWDQTRKLKVSINGDLDFFSRLEFCQSNT